MSEKLQLDAQSGKMHQRIGAAFLRLGGTQAIEQISVGRLVREAGIARSTFYAHYQSFDAYLNHSFAAILSDGADSQRVLPAGAILNHVAAAKDCAGRLARDSRLPAMMLCGERALRRVAEERLRDHLPLADAILRRSIAQMLAAGFLAMLREWVDQHCVQSVDVMRTRYEAVEDRLVNSDT